MRVLSERSESKDLSSDSCSAALSQTDPLPTFLFASAPSRKTAPLYSPTLSASWSLRRHPVLGHVYSCPSGKSIFLDPVRQSLGFAENCDLARSILGYSPAPF